MKYVPAHQSLVPPHVVSLGTGSHDALSCTRDLGYPISYAKKLPRVAWPPRLDSSRLCSHCSYSSEHESSGPISPTKSLKILFLWLTMSHAPLVRVYERRTRSARVCRGQTPIREPACLKGNGSDDNADKASLRVFCAVFWP
jgi:hypothetical protein